VIDLVGVVLAGVLVVQPVPAVAGVTGTVVTSAGVVATPMQLSGSAAGLAPLTSSEATTATGTAPEDGWKSNPQPPDDVVPAEQRDASAPEETIATGEEEALPSGVARMKSFETMSAAPAFVDLYPLSGSLVDGLRPTLRAWATSDSAVSYNFKPAASRGRSTVTSGARRR
jgi:hypothetical protein